MTGRARLLAALAGVALLGATSGCGDGSEATQPPPRSSSGSTPAGGEPPSHEAHPAETVTASHCPAGLVGCRATMGRVVYVERVDPDGDGDAHFVVADPQGITARGLTTIDVRKGLRPQPLPGIGDLISAAGPVQTGSYGQSQIHAVELHVAGR